MKLVLDLENVYTEADLSIGLDGVSAGLGLAMITQIARRDRK